MATFREIAAPRLRRLGVRDGLRGEPASFMLGVEDYASGYRFGQFLAAFRDVLTR